LVTNLIISLIRLPAVYGNAPGQTLNNKNCCFDNTQRITTYAQGSACVVTAALIELFQTSSLMYFLSHLIDTFLGLFLARYFPARKRRIVSHIVIWVIALVLMLVGAASNEFQGHDLLPYCGTPNSPYDWALIFVPACILMCLAFVTIVSTAFGLFFTSNQAVKNRPLIKRLHPFAFAWAFTLVCAIIFAYRVYIWNYTTTYNNSAVVWVTCLLTGGSSATCGEIPTDHIDITFTNVLHFVLDGQGLIAFICLSITHRTLRLWLSLCGKTVPPNDHELYDFDDGPAGTLEVTALEPHSTAAEPGRKARQDNGGPSAS